MSFPPRHPNPMMGMPPMPPGIIPPSYTLPPMGVAPMMPIGVMPGAMMPHGMTMGHMPDARAMGANQPPRLNMGRKVMPMPVTIGRRPQVYQKEEDRQDKGPTITVFVGNITDRASDNMVKQLLQKCGTVVSWKRVQGASGKLQAFGFCEYADPESGLRAIRLLHDWEIGDRKFVVKVDAKTKAQLDEYKAKKKSLKKESGSETPVTAEASDDVDEETKKEDQVAIAGIEAILRDHEHELSRPIPSESPKKKLSKTQEALLKISGQAGADEKDNLDEMDLEEDKKNLIHREIGKFRDTMKALSLSWCYHPSICSNTCA